MALASSRVGRPPVLLGWSPSQFSEWSPASSLGIVAQPALGMVARVIIAIPRHNNYHHPRAVAEGTSHCRTPACEGRPPVLGMVARCKALTKLSLTAPLLATPRGHTPLPRDCPQRNTHTSLAPSLSRHHTMSWGFPRPPVSPGKCLFYILKKMYLVLTETPRQGTSAGPFCCSTRRSKSRPVCLTNVGH